MTYLRSRKNVQIFVTIAEKQEKFGKIHSYIKKIPLAHSVVIYLWHDFFALLLIQTLWYRMSDTNNKKVRSLLSMETNLLLTSPETHINIIFILVAKLGNKNHFPLHIKNDTKSL